MSTEQPPAAPRSKTGKLKRTRWAVRAVLAAGVAASVAANVLHAQDDAVARAIAAWPPLAFFAVVEVVSHVPMPRIWYKIVAMVAAVATVGSVAAWISYWHMVSVTNRYQEQSPHMFPLSVDGLIVVASLALAELSSQIRKLTGEQTVVTATASWWERRQATKADRKAHHLQVKEARRAENDRLRREADARDLAAKQPPPPAPDPEVRKLEDDMGALAREATDRNRALGSPDGSLDRVPEPPVIEKLETLGRQQVAARLDQTAAEPWSGLKVTALDGWTPPVAAQQPVPPVQPEPQPEPAPEVPTAPAPPPEEPEVVPAPEKPRPRKAAARPSAGKQSPDVNRVAEDWIAGEVRAGRRPSLTTIRERFAVAGKPRSENWATARRRAVESRPRAVA